ncbi:single-stranded DNA-binding protein [Rarobacter faecitabidus]|uniref:Single-stranded DNA-binding protein n=1 Tax=Rarobacter faecitabidus TaxID=13243 RepID=A0A542Z841_RARFA|nr:single-stranded DNA-binding protein [Rarobacter faecitabidus]TQL56516.1 single-strand binding protein [Rarobacter faecitabidus]
MTNTITVSGNLGRTAELRFTPNGHPVLELAVPDQPRRKNREAGKWEDDGDVTWYRASLWGQMAEVIANANIAVKGAPVTVTGVLRPREYEKDGQTKTSLDIRVDTVKIDAPRNAQSHPTPPSTNNDPWGSSVAKGGVSDVRAYADDSAPF